MAEYTVQNTKLSGNITLPSSKNYTHRALICAALSRSKCVVSNISICDDVNATIDCLQKLGCIIKVEDDRAYINSLELKVECEDVITLDCKESASTLRFLIPVCAALGNHVIFTGDESLAKRPLSIYKELLPKHGINVKYKDELPFEIKRFDDEVITDEDGVEIIKEAPAHLLNGQYEIAGDVSSQFVSGLMFALPLIRGESKVFISGELQSQNYVDLTIEVLNEYGVKINKIDNGYQIKGNQRILSNHVHTKPDEAIAAIYLAYNKLGSNISFTNIENEEITNLINSFKLDDDNKIDASNIIDLIPTIAVLAAYSTGTTRIINTERLKLKESNRLESIANMITSLGGSASFSDDSITITGKGELEGGIVDSYNDHRIVFAAALAASNAKNSVKIKGAEHCSKSYPTFFEDIKSLGGSIND